MINFFLCVKTFVMLGFITVYQMDLAWEVGRRVGEGEGRLHQFVYLTSGHVLGKRHIQIKKVLFLVVFMGVAILVCVFFRRRDTRNAGVCSSRRGGQEVTC